MRQGFALAKTANQPHSRGFSFGETRVGYEKIRLIVTERRAMRNPIKSTLLNSTAPIHLIPKFVLTGGPCAGKTTAKEYLQEKLRDYGFTPFFIPEIPTEFILNGITPDANGFTRDQFQELLVQEVLRREAIYTRMIRRSSAPNKVIICDRGIMDVLAYSDPELFFFWLDKHGGLERLNARDERYDAVFHLVTAAQGAEEFYTLGNNKARIETLSEARKMDIRTLDAWKNHEHVHIIDNSTDFAGKMRRLLQKMCHQLGIPVPLEIERKFLVEAPDLKKIPIQVEAVNLEQAYLISADQSISRRIRKREQDGACMFLETNKQSVRPRVRVERQWPITKNQYLTSLAYEQDPECVPIHKKRFCFPWEYQYFALDSFEKPDWVRGLWILEIELTEEQQEVKLPSFLNIIKEVTDDPAFTNSELARKR